MKSNRELDWVEPGEAPCVQTNPCMLSYRALVGLRGITPQPNLRRRARGFTLVELVMVIALSAVVVVMITTALSSPMERLADQRRRGELVDLASTALNRMARDVRLAVPNSLRLSADGQAFELLAISTSPPGTEPSIDGAARYRSNRVGGESLRFSTDAPGTCGSTSSGGSCNSFQVLQPNNLPVDSVLPWVKWLVLYNVGSESGGVPLAGSNVWAYANPGVITPTGSRFSVMGGAPAGESQIAVTLPGGTSSFSFAFSSPQRRLYFADQVIGYRCIGAGNNKQLVRYSYNQLLGAVPASPPATSNPQPLANSVSLCRFNYQPGTTQRASLLSLTLGLSQAGESIELMQQVHVDNAP